MKSGIKEILVLHHSHLDIGYTHSQTIIEEQQKNFIDLALDLLEKSSGRDSDSQVRWTCEVTWQFEKWLERSSAAELERFRKYVREGRLSIGALNNNITPLGNGPELSRSLNRLTEIRALTGAPVKVAFLHDVTGLPWPMADLLLDAGVELLVMGINLHTAGDGPGQRPNIFSWQTPGGRILPVLNGHHYSGFDQIAHVEANSTEVMQKSLDEYIENVLEPNDYPYDFLYLTSTDVPLKYDNGQPNPFTAELVHKWNAEGRQPRIRYVSPEMLLEKVKSVPAENRALYRGDWTDFWNHGAASTAWETALTADSRFTLKTAGFCGVLNPEKQKERERKLFDEAWKQVVLYDEHTWTNWNSNIENPACRIQSNWKSNRAVKAHELANFVLAAHLTGIAGNDDTFRGMNAVLAINPNNEPIRQFFRLRKEWQTLVWGDVNNTIYEVYRTFNSNCDNGKPADRFLEVDLPPFSSQFLSVDKFLSVADLPQKCRTGIKESAGIRKALDNSPGMISKNGIGFIESPFHLLWYNLKNGRIVRILDRQTNWEVLPEGVNYDFFEPIHEEPDPRFDASRKSFYDRDAVQEMRFVSCWNPDWKVRRTGIDELLSIELIDGGVCHTLKRVFRMKGMDRIEHKITLFADRPAIEVEIDFFKQSHPSPEAVYCTTQLNLPEGWRGFFDTASLPVELDAEQLDGTSHSWCTSTSFAAMGDGEHCAAIFNAEAPLVQFGDFNFAKIRDFNPRGRNPFLSVAALDNYWETNFPLNQSGKISLRFGFQTYFGYDPARISRDAEAFSTGIALFPVEKTIPENPPETVLQLDDPAIKVESMESDDNGNVRLYLLNLSDEIRNVVLSWKLFSPKTAYFLSPDGAAQTDASKPSIDGKEIAFELPSRRLMTLIIEKK